MSSEACGQCPRGPHLNHRCKSQTSRRQTRWPVTLFLSARNMFLLMTELFTLLPQVAHSLTGRLLGPSLTHDIALLSVPSHCSTAALACGLLLPSDVGKHSLAPLPKTILRPSVLVPVGVW